MAKLTKKQKLWAEKLDVEKLYSLDEAIKLARNLEHQNLMNLLNWRLILVLIQSTLTKLFVR